MILLTRLNGSEFVFNAEKIRAIEATPDTLISTDGGDKLVVRESVQEVVKRSIDYARRTRKPLTD